MPAQSQVQQMMMGIAYAVKTGRKKIEDVDPKYKDIIKKLVSNMSIKQLKDFASTKHDGLPYKKESFNLLSFSDFVNEFMLNAASLNPGMTIPGIGDISLPSQPEIPISQQKPGSGDLLYIPSEESELTKKYKKKKRKKIIGNVITRSEH